MSIIFTFFKKAGNKESDKFRGTHAGPGDPPGQWDILARDVELKEAGIKMVVVEYHDATMLPELYKNKVKRSPYLDLRYNDEVKHSVAYPKKSQMTAPYIKEWALEVSEQFIGIMNATDNDEITVEDRIAIIENKQSQSEKGVHWIWPALGGIAIAGVGTALLFGTRTGKDFTNNIMSSIRGDRYLSFDIEQQFYDFKGDLVDPKDLGWERVTKEVALLDEEDELDL